MKGIAIFAVILSITLVAWLRFGTSESEDKVIVHAKYYLHPTNAGGYEYTLIRQQGKWIIEKAHGMWVS